MTLFWDEIRKAHKAVGRLDCRVPLGVGDSRCVNCQKTPPCIHLGAPTHRVRQKRTGCQGPTQLYVCTLHGDEVSRRPLTARMADGSTGPTDAAILLTDQRGDDYRPRWKGRNCQTCRDSVVPDFRDLAARDKCHRDAGLVTLACIDCVNPDLAALALDYSRRGLRFARVVLLSHRRPGALADGIEFVAIDRLDYQGYNLFCLRDLHRYIDTPHVLTIQTDGWILCPWLWRDEFREYDYIGAPWHREKEARLTSRVGNSGLCLRSKRLLEATAELMTADREAVLRRAHKTILDDITTCKELFPELRDRGFQFAPVDIAKRFSCEYPNGEPNFKITALGYHAKKCPPTEWLLQQLPPDKRHPAVDDKCIHRGGLLGELEYGCCGRPAVLACAIHGRCMRHGTAKPTPIKFTPLVGSTEQLTKNQMPHVCSSCEEREEVKKQEFVEELSLDFSATER
jgi:hypothetical protein